MSANKEIILDFIAAINRNDMNEAVEFLDPNCVYHNIPLDPVTGIEAIRTVLEGFNSTADEVKWVINNIAETCEGHVLTERTDSFRFGEKWVRLPVMGIFEVENGKITSWRDYFDVNQMVRMMVGG